MNDLLTHISGYHGLFGKIVGVFVYFFGNGAVRDENAAYSEYMDNKLSMPEERGISRCQRRILDFYARRKDGFFEEAYIMEHIDAYSDKEIHANINALITRGLLWRRDDGDIGLSTYGLEHIDSIIRE